MIRKLLALTCLLVFTCGCRTSEEMDASNKSILSGEGEDVGMLPDGRHVTRYKLECMGTSSHYIYVVPDTGSVSTNRHVPKTEKRVEVIINGEKYVPLEK